MIYLAKVKMYMIRSSIWIIYTHEFFKGAMYMDMETLNP